MQIKKVINYFRLKPATYLLSVLGSILNLQIKAGRNSIVAEGCVVKANQVIPDNAVAAGNPAKVMRGIEQKDVDFRAWGKRLYIDLAMKYLAVGMKRVDRE